MLFCVSGEGEPGLTNCLHEQHCARLPLLLQNIRNNSMSGQGPLGHGSLQCKEGVADPQHVMSATTDPCGTIIEEVSINTH